MVLGFAVERVVRFYDVFRGENPGRALLDAVFGVDFNGESPFLLLRFVSNITYANSNVYKFCIIQRRRRNREIKANIVRSS